MLLILISACTNKEEVIVDASDIIPHSKRDYDAIRDTSDEPDLITDLKNQFITNGILIDSLNIIKTKLFPDRVGPLSSEKYTLLADGNSVEYHKWTFSDSSKTINAFYNWVDMFKVDHLGDEVNMQREQMFILVGDTNLVYISGTGQSAKKWLDYHKAIGLDENWNYLIEQMLGGRARWFTFDDGKKVRFKNEAL